MTTRWLTAPARLAPPASTTSASATYRFQQPLRSSSMFEGLTIQSSPPLIIKKAAPESKSKSEERTPTPGWHPVAKCRARKNSGEWTKR